MKSLLPGRSSALLRATLDALTTAVIVLDEDLCVHQINQAAEILFDVSESRAEGLSIEELLPGNPECQLELRHVLATDQILTRRQAQLRTPAHGPITVDYSASPIGGRGPAALVLEFLPQDRALRISREEEIQSKFQTTRALVRGFAHEVKNPLGGIRGAAQLLERELDSPELKDYTRVIIDEADRLRTLVDQMLGPNKPPKLASMNIHEVLERVCTLIHAESGGTIQIERDYDPSLPELSGDRERLIQAVLNLVRNSMQALTGYDSPEVPTIRLRSRALRRYTIGGKVYKLVCHVSIIDNGPGIPDEIGQDIFYPMISGRADGSGLGLSIAQSIVQQHGGLIEYTSRPGHTEFSVLLPLEPKHAD